MAIRVIVTVSSLAEASGGPARSIPALCSEMADSGARVVLMSRMTVGQHRGGSLMPRKNVHTDLIPVDPLGSTWLTLGLSFGRALKARICEQSGVIVHDNGLWHPCNHFSAQAARRYKVPLLLSTRGMLEPWALAHKPWKKRVAWWLYQRADVMSAKVLHATSAAEAGNLRRLGLGQPIAMIPNGVDLPGEQPSENKSGDSPTRTALFLGRIYPVKGLLNLVAAWERVAPDGWRCVIAGPDQSRHQAEVERAIRDRGLERQFEFPGSIEDGKKWEVLAQADLFVLPSFSENFGIVVAEALAVGVPVITTKGTPWEEVVTHRCGWWVDIGVEPLVAALHEAMALTDDERSDMGRRGRHLVAEKYSWPRIAREMLSVYEWILDRGERPGCVVLK